MTDEDEDEDGRTEWRILGSWIKMCACVYLEKVQMSFQSNLKLIESSNTSD